MNDIGDAEGQRRHWQETYTAHPRMYGEAASEPGRYAAELFTRTGARWVAELGAGHGRDTLAFLRAGLDVRALDFSATGLGQLRQNAAIARLSEHLVTSVHDVRDPLPLSENSTDAVYAHMLLCMALTTSQLETLAGEIRRVLRPGGHLVYTVRHTGDAHYGNGAFHGDGMYEHGGFVVHFFDRPLVDRLAAGMVLDQVTEFTEGELPRRLWRITQHIPGG